MMRKLAWLLLWVSPLGMAEVVFDATYDLYWGNKKIGAVQRVLQQQNGVYTFTSNARPKGLARLVTKGINETSVFQLRGEQIVPMSYKFEQRGKESRTIQHHYYWDNRTLQAVQPDQVTVKGIKNDAMDILNFQYYIMRGLSQGKKTFTMTMYKKPRDPDNYTLATQGQERVSVKAGTFDTVRVARVGGDKRFNLWCAPALRYLPVLINLVDKKDKEFTMKLVRVAKY
jgi:thiol-disulfide isomerase/thioredoxin